MSDLFDNYPAMMCESTFDIEFSVSLFRKVWNQIFIFVRFLSKISDGLDYLCLPLPARLT